jgi:hypothetical protein
MLVSSSRVARWILTVSRTELIDVIPKTISSASLTSPTATPGS